jgi:hypothetical protein
MKRQFTKASKVVASLVLAAVLTVSASAQKIEASAELNVQYAGKLNNQPVFEVAYNKASTEVFTLTIKDNKGYIFYEETIRNSYAKKFLLDIPELDNTEIIITLTDKKGNEKQVYRINSKVSQVQDIAVTKL